MSHSIPLLKGFFLGASLIVAIGAQNAFVLRQGLQRQHVFITALLCSLIDATLISVGVGGFGTLVTSNKILLSIAQWGGVIFLAFYGVRSLRKAFRQSETMADDSHYAKISLKKTVFTLLAFSFLNPHVYLDTVVLIGTIGSQFILTDRVYFGLGASLASFTWFFSLCYGARILAPLFKKPVAWQILDFVIALVMFFIAASLLVSF